MFAATARAAIKRATIQRNLLSIAESRMKSIRRRSGPELALR